MARPAAPFSRARHWRARFGTAGFSGMGDGSHATWSQLAPLAGAVLLGAMSPGPDFAVVLRHSAASGRVAGTGAALGVATGILVWSVVAAAGVAGLLAASAVAFTVGKLAGATYLLLPPWERRRCCPRGEVGKDPPVSAARLARAARAFRDGLLCNVLNPKCMVFFVALLPHLPADPTAVDAAAVSAAAVLITALWFGIVANFVAAMRRLLSRPTVRRALDAVTGTLLVAVGVRPATQARTLP